MKIQHRKHNHSKGRKVFLLNEIFCLVERVLCLAKRECSSAKGKLYPVEQKLPSQKEVKYSEQLKAFPNKKLYKACMSHHMLNFICMID